LRRLVAASVAVAVVAGGAVYLVRASRTPPVHPATTDPTGTSPATSTTSPPVPGIGVPGTFTVAELSLTLVDTSRVADIGGVDVPRSLPTLVRYPSGRVAPHGQAGQQVATGQQAGAAPTTYPLVVFAPGYLQCRSAYAPLLESWASAGYVVAAVQFPETNCHMTSDPDESDIVNQPADVSFVITRILAASAGGHGPLAGLVDPGRIAVAGHSDGGDTVAAVAADSCCADPRVKAAIVLAGAELSTMGGGGTYYSAPTPPMLFVQGTADTVNTPAASRTLYGGDTTGVRYYLQLDGAGHYTPYEGQSPPEPTVALVTLDFLNRYVMGQAAASSALLRDGNVSGVSSLVSGGATPPTPPAAPQTTATLRRSPWWSPEPTSVQWRT
jgi:predicted dienelactone hydrolase